MNKLKKSMSKLFGNKVVSAGIGYTIGNFFIKGISFLTIPVFTRILSTSDYGEYNTYMAYESILFIIMGFALHSSIKNAKYEYGKKLDEYVSSVWLILVLNLIIFLILGNIFSKSIELIVGFNVKIINLLIIQSFSTSVITYYNSRISLDYKYKQFLILALINTLINIGLSLVLCLWVYPDDSRYLGRILGGVVATTLTACVMTYFILKRARPIVNLKYWRYGLSISIPLIPHIISQMILSQFDRIMIKNIIGSTEAGIYSFTYNISMILQVAISSFDNAWTPWFLKRWLRKTTTLLKLRPIYMLRLSQF